MDLADDGPSPGPTASVTDAPPLGVPAGGHDAGLRRRATTVVPCSSGPPAGADRRLGYFRIIGGRLLVDGTSGARPPLAGRHHVVFRSHRGRLHSRSVDFTAGRCGLTPISTTGPSRESFVGEPGCACRWAGRVQPLAGEREASRA